jgi:hypothetical protein
VRPRRARSFSAFDPFTNGAGSRCPQVGRWSTRMDAIRASSRIAQATLPAVLAAPRHVVSRANDTSTQAAIAPASAFALTSAAQAERSESRSSQEEERGADDLARRRELWARDMEVRTEDATELPDGSVHSLPTFEYEAGPDGRAYAVDGAQLWVPPQELQEEPEAEAAPIEHEGEAPIEEPPRDAIEVEARPDAPESKQKEHPPPIDPRCKSYTGDRDDAPPPGARLDDIV